MAFKGRALSGSHPWRCSASRDIWRPVDPPHVIGCPASRTRHCGRWSSGSCHWPLPFRSPWLRMWSTSKVRTTSRRRTASSPSNWPTSSSVTASHLHFSVACPSSHSSCSSSSSAVSSRTACSRVPTILTVTSQVLKRPLTSLISGFKKSFNCSRNFGRRLLPLHDPAFRPDGSVVHQRRSGRSRHLDGSALRLIHLFLLRYRRHPSVAVASDAEFLPQIASFALKLNQSRLLTDQLWIKCFNGLESTDIIFIYFSKV